MGETGRKNSVLQKEEEKKEKGRRGFVGVVVALGKNGKRKEKGKSQTTDTHPHTHCDVGEEVQLSISKLGDFCQEHTQVSATSETKRSFD